MDVAFYELKRDNSNTFSYLIYLLDLNVCLFSYSSGRLRLLPYRILIFFHIISVICTNGVIYWKGRYPVTFYRTTLYNIPDDLNNVGWILVTLKFINYIHVVLASRSHRYRWPQFQVPSNRILIYFLLQTAEFLQREGTLIFFRTLYIIFIYLFSLFASQLA